MPRAAALLLASLLLTALAAPALSGATPVTTMPPAVMMPAPETVTDGCPYQVSPVPPIDESEVVPPGSQTPTPLPVPDPPIGGDELGECGVVLADGAAPAPEGLTSAGWLIADLTAGTVLAAKDPHGRYRPASTIKVLLSLVVLEELDLDTTITGTQEDDEVEGDSAGVGPGGTYSVRDLMTGLILVSGNDCANALARELGGTDATLEKMNAMAQRLGAKDTRAASPSGLDAPGMTTSPYDEALIFRAALQNPDFVEMSRTDQARFPGYPGMPTEPPADDGNSTETIPQTAPTADPGIDLYNMNELLYAYEGTIAGKTGYTDDARKTFVGAAERDGRQILVVQMYGLNDSPGSFWRQATAMLDYGFAQSADHSIGVLVDGPDDLEEQLSAPDSPGTGGDIVSAPGLPSDSLSGTGKLVIGLVGALIVVSLIYAALSLNKRS